MKIRIKNMSYKLKSQTSHSTEESNVNRTMLPHNRTMPICSDSCEPGHFGPKLPSKWDIVDRFAGAGTRMSPARTGQLPFGKCYNQPTSSRQSAARSHRKSAIAPASGQESAFRTDFTARKQLIHNQTTQRVHA